MTKLIDLIEQRIQAVLPGANVIVTDPMQDETHFEAIVVSEMFEGISLVKQHQLVMNALKEDFAGDVHALALKTYTPTKWAERN